MPLIEIKAPTRPLKFGDTHAVIFLAGSIEMGTAPNWQEKLTAALSGEHVRILNPRRDDWDSSWVQSIDNAQFKDQVTWELEAMEKADIIVVHFCPETYSPITLLELGFWAGRYPRKLLVYCPEGFWRKGNVDIVCERYLVEQAIDFDQLVEKCKRRVAATFAPRSAT